jgi:hypothetical protein
MADTAQMSRNELLAARQQVTDKIGLLQARGYGIRPDVTVRVSERELLADLHAILNEIDAELAKLDSKNA